MCTHLSEHVSYNCSDCPQGKFLDKGVAQHTELKKIIKPTILWDGPFYQHKKQETADPVYIETRHISLTPQTAILLLFKVPFVFNNPIRYNPLSYRERLSVIMN